MLHRWVHLPNVSNHKKHRDHKTTQVRGFSFKITIDGGSTTSFVSPPPKHTCYSFKRLGHGMELLGTNHADFIISHQLNAPQGSANASATLLVSFFASQLEQGINCFGVHTHISQQRHLCGRIEEHCMGSTTFQQFPGRVPFFLCQRFQEARHRDAVSKDINLRFL